MHARKLLWSTMLPRWSVTRSAFGGGRGWNTRSRMVRGVAGLSPTGGSLHNSAVTDIPDCLAWHGTSKSDSIIFVVFFSFFSFFSTRFFSRLWKVVHDGENCDTRAKEKKQLDETIPTNISRFEHVRCKEYIRTSKEKYLKLRVKTTIRFFSFSFE